MRKAKDLAKEFQEKRILYEEVNDQELPLKVESGEAVILIDESVEKSTDGGKKRGKKGRKGKKNHKEKKEAHTDIEKLLEMIAKMKSDCKDEIRKLERRTKEMIELVNFFAGTSLGSQYQLADLRFRSSTWFPFLKRVFPHQQLLA